MHLGCALCDEALLDETIERIAADPMAFWIGGGDYCQWINRKDPRHKESLMAPWLHGVDDVAAEQRARLIHKLKPIAPKCLGLLSGNHEEAIKKHYERDVYMRLVEEMSDGRELMLGLTGFLTVILHRPNSNDCKRVVFYLHHGYGGGRMDGGKALTLGRLAASYQFDVAFMGHVHTRHVLGSILRLSPGDGKTPCVRERPMKAAFCGSFQQSYDSRGEIEQYGEMKGYPPLETGALYAQIQWRGEKRHRGVRQDLEIRLVV